MLFIFVMQNQKAKNDISTSNNNNNEEEEEEHDSYTSTQTTPHGVSRLIDRLLSTSYHALHSVSSIGLQFNAIYGPHGFGVPSTSVPIFHESRKRRCEFGGNGCWGLYHRWTNANKEKQEEQEEKDGEDSGGKKDEERQLNLIEEAGWMHLAHNRRDFVSVEGKISHVVLSSISHVVFSILDTLLPSYISILRYGRRHIITAMQYKAVQKFPTAVNIGSGKMSLYPCALECST